MVVGIAIFLIIAFVLVGVLRESGDSDTTE